MAAHMTEKPAVQPAETGWARSRRLRRDTVRTCLPAVAVEDRGRARERAGDAEGNIVRGED
ncbi:hypothetical protein ACH4C2_02225 [Streptomyces sp. NPDC018057]|uniref:hypothetical protein n=1 Tax=unclassified Streptomyces TaxID=2593676 RepID=UPI00378DAADD